MITGVKNTKKGFALPTVLISSIVMLIVLLTTVVSTVAVRTALLNQYYGQMAQSAGESGLVYAKACLAQSGGIAGWSNAKPLMPNTDCSGNEIVACPTAAADPKCYVSNTGNAYSSFSIKAPVLDSSGNASVLPNSGIVKLVRDSNGATWRTYTSPASQPTQVPNLCSGNADASDGWSNSTVYSAGGTIPGFEDPNAKQVTIYDGGVAPGPQFFRRDFSVAEDGSYDFKLYADDIGYLYIDDVQVGSAALSNVFTSGNFNLSYGCHVATVKLVNTGLTNNPSRFKLAVTKSGGSDDVLVSDTSWRYSRGPLKHFSEVDYYAAPNAWTSVRDIQAWNAVTPVWGTVPSPAWNTTSGDSGARRISTAHSYDGSNNYPSNSTTYFRSNSYIYVSGLTQIRVSYACDDTCVIWLDGNKIATTGANSSATTEYIDITLTEGAHQFGVALGNGSGPAGFLFAAVRSSDNTVFSRSDSSWTAAYFWESSLNDYYSYDKNFTPTLTDSVLAKVLVVGGGGGGGSNMGGGGGGGGVVYDSAYSVKTNSYYVTVGDGGSGASAGISQLRGSEGSPSNFGTLVALGGGGGGSEYSNNNSPPSSGSSGGGSAGCNQNTVGQGTTGQGYRGGLTTGCYYPTGGGGAGGLGVSSPGNGGVGILNSILGTAYYWGGGGGGAGYSNIAGNGGLGGGGGGAPKVGGGGLGGGSALNSGSDGTVGVLVSQTNVPGGDAGANTGGGGGGGAHYNSNNYGGNGGSGIVAISYPIGSVTATGGIMTTSGGNTIHTYKTSGYFKVGPSPRTSCSAILNAGESTGDGPYWIYPAGSTGVQVYCDMTNDGGGWTLVLQNNSTVTTPAPNWSNAINGNTITGNFGFDLAAFDNLVGLANWNNIGTKVRLQVGAFYYSISHKATYDISLNTGNFYALSLSNENILIGGTQPGFYTTHNNQPFTTYDSDHDANAGNCATNYQNHPWWYTSCWGGNFFAGGSYQDAPYWSGSTTDYYAYGSIWLK